MNAALVLADTQINTDTVTPGVLGFIVVALIATALYFLMKSMLGKLREVRGKEFDGVTGAGGDAEGGANPATLESGESTENRTTEHGDPRDGGRS